MSDKRDLIESTIDDLVSSFLYYDRKDDDELPREAIEAAVAAGEITQDEIVEMFREYLARGLTRD